MTSREVVRRAIEFRHPERLPMWQAADPYLPSDLQCCFCLDRNRTGRSPFNREVSMDDWGCEWARAEEASMGEVFGHPLADWGALRRWMPPNPADPFYFEGIEEAAEKAGDYYLGLSMGFNLIELHHMLRGFENSMMDYHLEPERTARLLDMVVDYRLAQIEEVARRCGDRMDGLFLTDDWGTQQATFISPATFNHFFRDRYRRLAEAAHAKGMHLNLHTCGRVNAFVPAFIEAGIDSLGLGQPLAYGIPEMGELARGKIAIGTSVDIQKTLPTNDLHLIRREAFEIVEHWGAPEGGLLIMAGAYGDVKPESLRAMVRAFVEASKTLGKPRAA